MQQLDLLTGDISQSPPNTSMPHQIEDPTQYIEFLQIIEVGLAAVTREFTKQGPNYKSLCPFHQEKTPSFYLKPEKNFYICYGCQELGSPLRLIYEKDPDHFDEILEASKLTEEDILRWWSVDPDKRDLAQLIREELERYR